MTTGTRLEGRVALVTGASRGIGLAIATALARAGAHTVLADLAAERDSASDAARRLVEEGLTATAATIDVTDAGSVEEAVSALDASGFGPTILVNNAGISVPAPTLETTLQQWNRVLAVNLTGAFLCSRACLPIMRRQGWGRIVCVSSFNAKSAPVNGDNASYAASKAGLTGLVHNLALEFARDGITVNAVAPGIVDTDLLRGAHPPERLTQLTERLPIGRFTRPDEVAATAAFLASDAAASITGEIVNVNGGLYFD